MKIVCELRGSWEKIGIRENGTRKKKNRNENRWHLYDCPWIILSYLRERNGFYIVWYCLFSYHGKYLFCVVIFYGECGKEGRFRENFWGCKAEGYENILLKCVWGCLNSQFNTEHTFEYLNFLKLQKRYNLRHVS